MSTAIPAIPGFVRFNDRLLLSISAIESITEMQGLANVCEVRTTSGATHQLRGSVADLASLIHKAARVAKARGV